MKLIPLTQGKSAQVDDADFDWLNQWKWYAKRVRKGYERFYAARNSLISGNPNRRITQFMHVQILGLARKGQTDHEDGDGLNNQRKNLRRASPSENQGNRGLRKDSTSGFKGIWFHPDNKNWVAAIRANGKRFHLGVFEAPEVAARAYDIAAVKYFGPFARLNFPKD